MAGSGPGRGAFGRWDGGCWYGPGGHGGQGGHAAKAATAATATPPTLNLKVLLIGSGSADPTTAAWAAALASEGVPYTEATRRAPLGSETVTLPTLTTSHDR